MLNEQDLERAEAQLLDFRSENDTLQKAQARLIEKYARLIEDYKRLKSDYEEEREARERYKQLARGKGQQLTRSGEPQNPFVLVLIDGDDYIFDDDMVSNGSNGGTRAAHMLNDAIKTSLRSRNLDHCRIVVRMYANLVMLSKTLSKNKLCGADKRSLAPFFSSFNHANELFDFADSGETKDSTEIKIRATFNQFVNNPQCRHIFFAGCHSSTYVAELTPHASKRDQISLIRSYDFHPEFSRLALRTEDFPAVFRSSPLLHNDALPAPASSKSATSLSATAYSNSTTAPVDLSNVCSFNQKGLCKYGKSCKFTHLKTGSNGYLTTSNNISSIKDWRKDASPNNSAASPFSSTSPLETYEEIQAEAEFIALLPREEDVPENQIPINENQQRLDPYLPNPSMEDRAHFNARTARQKLCNHLQLNGTCTLGPACPYDHSEITEGMRHCLKQITHNVPCPRRGDCRYSMCLYGHICQKSDCQYRGGRAICKFPAAAHQVDLNVYEYVASVLNEPAKSDSNATDENGLDNAGEAVRPPFERSGSSSLRYPNSKLPSPLTRSPPPVEANSGLEARIMDSEEHLDQETSQQASEVDSWWQQ